MTPADILAIWRSARNLDSPVLRDLALSLADDNCRDSGHAITRTDTGLHDRPATIAPITGSRR